MKTLQAFWRWVDNEKPGTLTVIQKACGEKALTVLARTAIDQAADVVWAMHRGTPVGFSLRFAFDQHRDDLRDISLALLPALEKVVERRNITDRLQAIAERASPVLARVPAKLASPVRTCVGCGLTSEQEQTVLHPRVDGKARCNDCARHAPQKGIILTAHTTTFYTTCGRCNGSGTSPDPVHCGRCGGLGAVPA